MGLTEPERKRATKAFHAEKEAYGNREHMPYGDLINWPQNWREDEWRES